MDKTGKALDDLLELMDRVKRGLMLVLLLIMASQIRSCLKVKKLLSWWLAKHL